MNKTVTNTLHGTDFQVSNSRCWKYVLNTKFSAVAMTIRKLNYIFFPCASIKIYSNTRVFGYKFIHYICVTLSQTIVLFIAFSVCGQALCLEVSEVAEEPGDESLTVLWEGMKREK